MAPHTGQPPYESSRARCERELASEVQLIIPDKAHKNVLLASVSAGTWRLPGVIGDDIDTVSIPAFRNLVKERIGLDLDFIVLRLVHSQRLEFELPNHDVSLIREIFTVECSEEPNHLPDGFQWIPIIDGSEGCVVNIVHSEADAEGEIRRELHGLANGLSPARRVPWGSISWYENVTRWVREVFDHHDLHMIGRMEQIRSSTRSAVLKINTERSSYYVKCSSSTSNDAGITSVMCAVAPKLVRKPLAVDVERRLMILKDHGEDFGVCALSDDDSKESMKSLALLHKASACAFDKLVEAGLPVYTPQWMIDNWDVLLDSEELAFMQDSELWESLHGIKGRVIDALVSIASWKMPNCLVHNDVFDGNMTRNADEAGGGFYYFDFDSSFGGHPVFDLDWWNRELAEVYAEEMGITDVDRLYELSRAAFRVRPLVDAFRYIERVRAAEEGGIRNDELEWLMDRFPSLVLRFKPVLT